MTSREAFPIFKDLFYLPFDLFLIMYFYIRVCGYVHMNEGAHRGQKVLDLLKLEL